MAAGLNRRQAIIHAMAVGGGLIAASGVGRARGGMRAWHEAGLRIAAAGEFTLPQLPYGYKDLEPSIDAETMEIHYSRHHKAYVDNANKALAGTPFTDWTSERIVASLDEVPEDKRTAVRNNLGGHVNHSMFWLMMAPTGKGGGGEPTGAIADAIARDFGSFAAFKEKFAEAAAKRFGSGWAWLVSHDGKLSIASTANQDCPLMPAKYAGDGATGTPVLGLDVWEHAYYLKYRNKRADYVSAWWNVVNWTKVAQLHTATLGDSAEITK